MKSTRKIFFLLTFLILAGFALQAVPVYAQSGGGANGGSQGGANAPTGTGLVNPLQVDTLEAFLLAILAGVVELGTIFLVLMLVYVGFLFVTAQGKEEKISEARKALVWTVIGGLILLGATSIQLVVTETVRTL
jgi:hypothetical protein